MEVQIMKSVLSVLIIEDNLGDIRIIQETLKESLNYNYNISYCQNLADGLDAIAKNKFDLLLLDLMLPDSTGLDSLNIIKKCNPDLPIVVLTMDSNEGLGLPAIKFGAQDFLIKGHLHQASIEKIIDFAIERKNFERKIKNTEELFEITFEKASVGMAHLSLNGSFLKINKKYCQITGYTEEELIGRNIDSITHKNDVKGDENEFSRLLNNEISDYHFENCIIKKDGSISWVHSAKSLIRTKDNRVVVFLIIEDINIKKRNSEILNQSFENYKLLAENSPDIIIRFDKNLNFIYVNPPIEKINGKKPDELIGRNLSEITPQKQFKIWNSRFDKIARLKKKQYFQDVLDTIEGERTVETIFVPEFDNDGDVNFILTISRDITERIESQREIERKNILLEKILSNIPVGVWIVDEHGNMTLHNKASEEIWGGTENISIRKQPEFKGWWADSGKRIQPEQWASYNAFKYGSTYLNQIINFECFDGTKRTMLNSAIPMFDKNKKVIGVVVVNQDVTRFIQIENELKASLEEKEMLMKEIHHRVKNNFQVIASLLNLQRSSLKNKNVEEVLLESQNRIKSMAILHEKLYRSGDLIRINLSGYLKDLLKSLQNSYQLKERNINIELNMDDIYVSTDDAIHLGLIINELVVNSLKYAFAGRNEGSIYISLKENDNNNLELIVKDNGIGIPKEINVENSDSMGLLLINTFVKQVKGNINLKRDNGTEFCIISPRIPGDLV